MASWFEDNGFELIDPPPDLNVCAHAQAFSEWADVLCANVEAHPSGWAINQAKLVLSERYFEWYAVVPRKHRETVRDRAHRCIFHVFRDAWLWLRQIQLTVDPPAFEPPASPRQGPRGPLDRLLLGDVEHDPEFGGG